MINFTLYIVFSHSQNFILLQLFYLILKHEPENRYQRKQNKNIEMKLLDQCNIKEKYVLSSGQKNEMMIVISNGDRDKY